MKTPLSILFVIFACVASLSAQDFEYFNGQKAQSGELVYKVKAVSKLKSAEIEPTSRESEFFKALLESSGAQSEIMFPYMKPPSADCHNCADLTRVYRLTYDPQKINLTQLIVLLRRFSFIEYAEPLYVDELLFTPNDTYTGNQWFMDAIKLFDAWDLDDGKGDCSVVIGIVDSGTEINHLDLNNQIAYNVDDPINGVDDDKDGFIDNYYGWDFGESDNNPNPDGMIHGTCVAGLSSAEVDNEEGISGSGYKCKFLPIKIATKSGLLIRSYEAVVYAADHNCNIINCSWGSLSSSEYAKEVIQYATFNKNALVIGAAGNSGNTGVLYPASYEYVLSVGGSVKNDIKWSGSNYNYFIDVCAPTTGYLSTNTNNRYIDPGGGTSFSAPIVAGVAGLVKAKFPDYSAIQIGEQVRVNADDMYNIAGNEDYQHSYSLGKGRVNAYKALTQIDKPAIRIDSVKMRNANGSSAFELGDILEIDVYCTNYLAALDEEITFTFDAGTTYFERLNSELFESIEHLEQKKLTFQYRINSTFNNGAGFYFNLLMQSPSYFDYEFTTLFFNPPCYDFEFNNFKATATANGTIGVYNLYSKNYYGLRYGNNPSMLYDAGLMLALNDSTTAAGIRQNNSFFSAQRPIALTADSVDLLIESKYSATRLNIEIEQYIYGWNNVDALIHEYRFTNTDTITLENIRSGIFANWIIGMKKYNVVSYVDSLQCAIISSIDKSGFLVGVMPLHHHKSSLFAFDETTKIDNIPYIDYFEPAGIWKLLTSTKTTAGINQEPNASGDVSTTSWNVIGSIAPQETDTIRYAIIAGKTFDEIVSTARNLKQRYVTDTSTQLLPCDTCSPSGNNALQRSDWIQLHQNQNSIELHAEAQTQAFVQISTLAGAIVEERNHNFAHGAAIFATDNLPQGVYIISARNKNEYQTFTIVITN